MTARDVPLAALTTLRLGGPARELLECDDEQELVRAVTAADERGEPVLVLGGGSNLVVADEGFPGTVLAVRTRGMSVDVDADVVTLEVAAGEPWDVVVVRAVEFGWSGVECLAGIPGLSGATPMQNVGAYGQDVAGTVARVRAYDRRLGQVVTLSAADCGFGYRTSRFKREPGAFVVLAVTYRLPLDRRSEPIGYAALAQALDIALGERAPLQKVRAAVLGLRRAKGMVLDPADRDTWSAGSFFMNPVLDADDFAALRERAAGRSGGVPPEFPADDGRIKTSAAWLIERAGFGRGYGSGAVRVSTKHTLALTHRGDGTSAELVALAREIRSGVLSEFGVTLEPEPVLVGVSLD